MPYTGGCFKCKRKFNTPKWTVTVHPPDYAKLRQLCDMFFIQFCSRKCLRAWVFAFSRELGNEPNALVNQDDSAKKCACGSYAIKTASKGDRLAMLGKKRGQCYACAGITT